MKLSQINRIKRIALPIALCVSSLTSCKSLFPKKQTDHFEEDNTIEEFLSEDSKLAKFGYYLQTGGILGTADPETGMEFRDFLSTLTFYDDDGSEFVQRYGAVLERHRNADRCDWRITFSNDFSILRLYFTKWVQGGGVWPWWYERFYRVDALTAERIKDTIWAMYMRRTEPYFDANLYQQVTLSNYTQLLREVNKGDIEKYTIIEEAKVISHIDEQFIESLDGITSAPIDLPLGQRPFIYPDFDGEKPTLYMSVNDKQSWFSSASLYVSANKRYAIVTFCHNGKNPEDESVYPFAYIYYRYYPISRDLGENIQEFITKTLES